LDSDRVEFRLDDDSTDDGLAENPDNERDGKPRQVTPSWNPYECAEHSDRDSDDDEPGKQAVDLLDRRMSRADIDEVLLVARRPVATAESRSGQAHQCTGDDDDTEQHQRNEGDPSVGNGRERAFHGTRQCYFARLSKERRCADNHREPVRHGDGE